MRILILILCCFLIIDSYSLVGQCPARDTLLKRLAFFRNSPSYNKTNQLNELLGYDIKSKNCSYRNDSVYTFLLASIGVTYFLLGDYIDAIQYTKKALNTIYAYADNPAINKFYLGKYYYYLSVFYDSLKQVNKKNEAADSCIANEIKLNTDYQYTSFLLMDRVRDLFFEGEYNLCIDMSALGEALIHRFYRYDDSLNLIAYFIYYKTRALYSLNKFFDAEKFLSSKHAWFSKIKNKNYVSATYSLYGYLYKAKGNYKSAIDYFAGALQYDLQTADKAISAQVLNQIGTIYSEKIEQGSIGLHYFREALKYANAQDSVYIFGNIANVYTRMSMFDSAYFFFQAAFNKIKPGIDENDLSVHIGEYVNANNAEFVIELVLDKADAYLHQYFCEKNAAALHIASHIYKSADHLLTNIKSEQSELASKLFWRNYARRLYEHAIETSSIENDLNSVFYFFEKSRAELLNEQINQLSKASNDDILKKAGQEKKIIELERKRNSEEASSSKYLEIQKELITVKQKLKLTEEIIKKNNPLYYQSFLDTTFISLKDVQQELLHDHQALIELFNGDSNVYILLITAHSVNLNRINKTDYDNTIRSYISCISNPDLLNSNYAGYCKTAHHLYQLLFQNNLVPNGRIIISPDGQYFPFEALIANSEISSPVYFLNDHAVSYTYSARFLLNNFANSSSEKNKNFLGIAPVKYDSFSMASLDGSDYSIHKIENYFTSADDFISKQASKNNFETQFSKYRLIQLYTHASDSSKNNEPVIFFADSALFLSDLIPENKPATQLIVLSACETGKGQFYLGEGVFSFNRGFAALGIPSSITNLWSVDSKSTYNITELFYKYLTKGLPLDVALQKAKKEFIQTGSKEYSLPYFWAASVLVGKTDAIGDSNHEFSWKLIVLSASACLLLLLAAKYFLRNLFTKSKIHFIPTQDKGGTAP